jgi:hypothetical protein
VLLSAIGCAVPETFLGIPSDFANAVGIYTVGGHMSLEKEFIRDGKRRIIGSVI